MRGRGQRTGNLLHHGTFHGSHHGTRVCGHPDGGTAGNWSNAAIHAQLLTTSTPRSGSVVQQLMSADTAAANGTTVIPVDMLHPQVEGPQFRCPSPSPTPCSGFVADYACRAVASLGSEVTTPSRLPYSKTAPQTPLCHRHLQTVPVTWLHPVDVHDAGRHHQCHHFQNTRRSEQRVPRTLTARTVGHGYLVEWQGAVGCYGDFYMIARV